jgi:hypothetical protein
MKQYLFGAVALLFISFFAACEKESLTGDFTPTTDLAAGDRGGGSDSTAHCMRGDTLDVASLPQAITDYLTANYPTATVVTAVSKRDGRAFAVELSDGTILIFRGNGDLLGECGNLPTHPGGPHGPGGPGNPDGGCLSGDTLTIADLPAGVTDYVSANYANTTIQTVVSKRNGLAFAVGLSDGTVLIFKADGTFVGTCPGQSGPGGPGNGPGPNPGGCMRGDTLAITDLPAGVTDYVAANYANTTIQTVVSKRQGLAFAVELSDGTVLIFKADGTFVGTCTGNGPHGPGNGPGGPGNGPHGPGNGPHGGGH